MVELASGSLRPLCTDCAGPASWGDDGAIVVAGGGALWEVPENGGMRHLVAEPRFNGEPLVVRNPTVLPGGRNVLFQRGSSDSGGVYIVSLDTEEVVEISADGLGPRWADTGHVLFVRGSTLMVVAFDVDGFRASSDAIPLRQSVRVEPNGSIQAAISLNGVLAYAVPRFGGRVLIWVDREGREKEEPFVEQLLFGAPRISRDGKRVAVEVTGDTGRDIWVGDIASGTLSPLTRTGTAWHPVWTIDSGRVVFSDDDNWSSLRWIRANGSGSAETLYDSEGASNVFAESGTPDGERLIVRQRPPADELMVLELTSKRISSWLETPDFHELAARLSPDGRWLAFSSDKSGTFEVYVRGFPAGPEHKVSIGGGTEPVWAPDGSKLFYKGPTRLTEVSVELEGDFPILERREMFDIAPYRSTIVRAEYDIHPDTGDFLMVTSIGARGERDRINVVLNWFDELKRLVPTGR
jgi:serine/threonine-protein kinase